MYTTVSVRIGISWCVQYCVSKDRISWCVQYCVSKDSDLLVCRVLSVRIGISWCVQYCVSKDRDLLVCRVLCQ